MIRGRVEPYMTLEEILEVTGGRLVSGIPEGGPSGVSTDTRTILPGQLFVALKGERYDGHDFLSTALAKGAWGALVSSQKGKGTLRTEGSKAILIEVEDTLEALGDLAKAWRGRHQAVVVGVTGSNGKTTTKEMLASVLETSRRVLKNRGNLNNRVGLPLTLLELRPYHRVAVLEMGMSEPGEMKRLCDIARPQVGLITQVAPAHLQGVGSIEGVAREKGELFSSLGPTGTALVNLDDPWVVRLARACNARKVSYGLSPGAIVRAADVEPYHPEGARLRLELSGQSLEVRLRGQGTPLVRAALAAAAGAWTLGSTAPEIREGLEAFEPFAGRLKSMSLPWGGTLIDDTYNANPSSMAAALELLCRGGGGRTVAVLGEMRELGPVAPWAHRELGRMASQLGVQVLVAVGCWAPQVVQGAQDESGETPKVVKVAKDCDEAIRILEEILTPEDRVLVKGSRAAAMERVVQALMHRRAEAS